MADGTSAPFWQVFPNFDNWFDQKMPKVHYVVKFTLLIFLQLFYETSQKWMTKTHFFTKTTAKCRATFTIFIQLCLVFRPAQRRPQVLHFLQVFVNVQHWTNSIFGHFLQNFLGRASNAVYSWTGGDFFTRENIAECHLCTLSKAPADQE